MHPDMSEPAWIDWVRETVARDEAELPAMPAVAVRLVDLLEGSDAELDEIERVVSQEQAIADRVIRPSYSLLYRGSMPVKTVSRAAMRLCFRETAQIALAAACRALYDPRDRVELETFPELWAAAWQDSLVCAFGARLLSRELKLGDPERVFLGAMFRHVGNLLVLKVLSRGLVGGELHEAPDTGALARGLAALHAGLGADYLRSAGMPEHAVEAAGRHHDPEIPFAADRLELHVIRVADGL